MDPWAIPKMAAAVRDGKHPQMELPPTTCFKMEVAQKTEGEVAQKTEDPTVLRAPSHLSATNVDKLNLNKMVWPVFKKFKL